LAYRNPLSRLENAYHNPCRLFSGDLFSSGKIARFDDLAS
jgi:hypothetical protein